MLLALIPGDNSPAHGINSIEEWITLYGDDILRLAYLYTRDRSKSEDVFQEVFIRAYRKSDSFRGDSSIKTWLLRITMNVCRDMMREFWWRRVMVVAPPEQIDRGLSAEHQALLHDRNDTLLQTVYAIPRSFKEVILLYYYEELETKEISTVLRIPEGTVRSRLHRAREHLKQQLKGKI